MKLGNNLQLCKYFTFTNRNTYLLVLESIKIYIKIHTKCSYMFRSMTIIRKLVLEPS
jgi:hypothetical protein